MILQWVFSLNQPVHLTHLNPSVTIMSHPCDDAQCFWLQISERCWWKNLSRDIRQFIRGCDACQKANAANKPVSTTLHPVSVQEVLNRWGIDMVGPLNETRNGNKYIIMATEYRTKWPEEEAVADKSADTIHAFLFKLVCHVLLHDQGHEFNNTLVKGLCAKL